MEPTEEQQRAIDLFASGDSFRLNAYAGAGKTSTLIAMAASRAGKGLSFAFNRSIATEAKRRFPEHVRCSTGHSIAFREVRRHFGYAEEKLTGKLTAQVVADAFRLPQSVSFHCDLLLPGLAFGSVLLETVKRFLHSADGVPMRLHVPRAGVIAGLGTNQFISFAEQTASQAGYLWNAMRDRRHNIPLGHDEYLKLWFQAQPKPAAQYILVDEAQDLNPALLHALMQADCQVVYVGDPYQQIYEWRGAVNAMELVKRPHRSLLSQLFRFGKEIAAAASIVLRTLGARSPVQGLASLESHVGRVRPQAILSRSNVGVIGSVLKLLEQGRRCHIIGGSAELELFLLDVARIQAGQQARSAELLGFPDWPAVMRASVAPEGVHLRALVTLVKEYGVTRMLNGLAACVGSEVEAEVVCSTVHKAKGREWDYVQVDTDFEAAFTRAAKLSSQERQSGLQAEGRLLYVALTRAKTGIQIPPPIAKRFGIRNTTPHLLG